MTTNCCKQCYVWWLVKQGTWILYCVNYLMISSFSMTWCVCNVKIMFFINVSCNFIVGLSI